MTIKKAKAEAIADAQPKKIYKSIKQLKLIPSKLVLKDEDGPMLGEDGLPITVTVISAETREAALSTEALFQDQARDEDSGIKSIEKVWTRNGGAAASALTGWSHDSFWGEPFSKEYAAELLSDPEFGDIVSQIIDYSLLRSNFTTK